MSDIDFVGTKISHHLNRIAELFKNPKITLVVRSPDLPDGDLIMTHDDLGEVIASLERTWGRTVENVDA